MKTMSPASTSFHQTIAE